MTPDEIALQTTLDTCPDCELLGAEVCPRCTDYVLRTVIRDTSWAAA